ARVVGAVGSHPPPRDRVPRARRRGRERARHPPRAARPRRRRLPPAGRGPGRGAAGAVAARLKALLLGLRPMSRFTVCVIRDFVAQHFLIGGDWGRENEWHSHHYKLEVSFAGDELDQHAYLLDIAVVKEHLGRLVARFADKTL